MSINYNCHGSGRMNRVPGEHRWQLGQKTIFQADRPGLVLLHVVVWPATVTMTTKENHTLSPMGIMVRAESHGRSTLGFKNREEKDWTVRVSVAARAYRVFVM